MESHFLIVQIFCFQISILQLIFLSPSFSIILDSSNCDKGDITTQYPLIWNPQMRYYLFTSDNLLEGVEIQNQNISSLQGSKFDKTLPTRIFVSCSKSTVQNCKTAIVKDAYLKSGNFNFILADWSDWNTREYSLAGFNVNSVGTLLGNFTKFLNANGVSFSDIYLIGHDLGAHVAGAAGKSIAPDKYKTIYGLDPSNQGFDGVLIENRLDPSDAEYVEVISTDVFFNGYGASALIGHAVFLPNNGRRIQPICPNISITNWFDVNAFYCSHAAAADYFAKSLNKNVPLCGVPTTWLNMYNQILPQNLSLCNVIMGGEPSVPKTGYYFVP